MHVSIDNILKTINFKKDTSKIIFKKKNSKQLYYIFLSSFPVCKNKKKLHSIAITKCLQSITLFVAVLSKNLHCFYNKFICLIIKTFFFFNLFYQNITLSYCPSASSIPLIQHENKSWVTNHCENLQLYCCILLLFTFFFLYNKNRNLRFSHKNLLCMQVATRKITNCSWKFNKYVFLCKTIFRAKPK